MGVDQRFPTSAMLRLAWILLALTALSQALEMSFADQTVTVTVGGTSKTASCDITVSYSGSQVLDDGSSVSCSIPWPKNKALNKAVDMFVVVGDVTGDLINVNVQFTLFKKKNKASSTTKTKSPSFTGSEYQTDEPASYPSDLWCPAEDKIIFTNNLDNIVNETAVTDWQACAELCSTYINSAGNSPCFSWTFNNAASQVLGLEAGACRLLSYASVERLAATGVQSGYHKCWAAYLTSVQP